MTYRLPSDLPAQLRKAGLTVIEIPSWQTRHRPGAFGPVGVLNHHTGSRDVLGDFADDLSYAKWMFTTGRSDLPAPLCQISLSLEGTVYVGASGRANHAGRAKSSGSVAAGDGNALYVGIEWMLSGTQAIPKTMYDAGVTLNAVLLKILGSSERAASCHYQTSVTGKWDIGDPNGVPFNGKKVLDVPKFRTAIKAKSTKLYPPVKPPAQAPKPKAINVRIRECSMQYSDTPAQKAIDARAAFNPTPGGLRPHVVLFTEAGRGQNKVGQDLLRKEGERLGYAMFFDGYEGGIAIRFAAGRVVDHGYEGPIIPGKAGDHPHLGLTWATARHRTLGDMTFGVMHWLNRDVEAARARINDAATKKVGAFLAAKAVGDDIGFLAGDANRDDKTRDLLPGIPFRTAADELGVYPDTHGTRTIDFIASYDKDLRVRCTAFRTLPRAHSDHRWIEATYAITPRSAA